MATKAAETPKREVTIRTPSINDKKGSLAIVKQPSKEVLRALSTGIEYAVVDIRLSSREDQEADLARSGYTQLLQGPEARRSAAGMSTFGNKVSMWTWSRSKGTCSGRLKPIIDVQLHKSATSSDFVLSGYTCCSTPCSGQWLWIKRAVTEEEEKDAIVDFHISTGKMKDTSDPVWTSPGVGWVRVEGNFTKSFFGGADTILWLRPARTRSMDVHINLRGSLAITEEVRYAKLLSACRLALRHHVSVGNVKRLANIKMESALAPTGINSNLRSERMVDFTALFHHAAGRGSSLNSAKLGKMLLSCGLHLDKPDLQLVFNLFDSQQTDLITIEQFGEILALTDYELDLAIEKIRVHLLQGCAVPSDVVAKGALATNKPALSIKGANSGVLDHGIGKSTVGRNVIRENFTLASVFELVNTKDDGIFSLDEMMDLAAKVEVFLTEEEARKCLRLFDLNGDDRVEEADFIGFMRQESHAHINKAFRVRESAGDLRRWLVRGTTENGSASAASASAQQWRQFKLKFEKLTRRTFPGFLDAQVLMITLANLGTRLSSHEARELTLLVAPEKNGRIHQADLHAFMGRESRSYGELVALLERELMREVIDAYRAHYNALLQGGREDPDLADQFRKKVLEVKRAVEKVYARPVAEGENEGEYYAEVEQRSGRRASMEVISIQQLKDGLESYCRGVDDTLKDMPNLEEWASLTVLVNADVAEGDIYGVRLKEFVEGLCTYSVATAEDTKLRVGERMSLETVARRLQRQIFTEALNAGKGKKPDYRAIFDMFDEDGNGQISIAEFKKLLTRLQLVNSLPEHQMPSLLGQFSRSKHTVKFEDFVAFAEKGSGKEMLEEGEEVVEEEEVEEDLEDLTQDTPPVTITRNGDCDWLLWYMYRRALQADAMDPESVITELQIRCNESELTQKDPAISVKELWNHLFELSLNGSMTHEQFVKGVQLVCQHGSGREDDRVDYEALCKYAIRMGRAYIDLVQKRRADVEALFPPLLAELKKYFQDLGEERIGEAGGMTRYEKIFRRMDSDGDGMLTPKEFKMGLRRLHYKNLKAWTMPLVRRLFDTCDRNKDGLLSVAEWSAYVSDTSIEIKGSNSKNSNFGLGLNSNTLKSAERLNLSDDEDNEVFHSHKAQSEGQLMIKVNETLMEIVPLDPTQGAAKHAEVVRASVRRFFQRADATHTGTVSEERFRAFLRRSGLQDALTAADLRRLGEKLKRKVKGEAVVDYESLCAQLHSASEKVPRSRADQVLARLAEAATRSALAQKPFPYLCSLVDLRLSGRISKEELLVTAKMMDCPLSNAELEALLELVNLGRDGTVDYRLLHQAMCPHLGANGASTPHNISTSQSRSTQGLYLHPPGAGYESYGQSPGAIGAAGGMGMSMGGTGMGMGMGMGMGGTGMGMGGHRAPPSPGYGAGMGMGGAGMGMGGTGMGMGGTSMGSMGMSQGAGMMGQSMGHGMGTGAMGARGMVGASTGAYERILRLIVERVKVCTEERGRQWGEPFSLRRQLEIFDSGAGTLSMQAFQSVLRDLGVLLSPSDLQTVYGLYGRPEDNHVFYEPFCRAVEGLPANFSQYGAAIPSINSMGGMRDTLNPHNPMNHMNAMNPLSMTNPGMANFSLPLPPGMGGMGGMGASMGGLRSSAPHIGTAPYLQPRVLARLRELRNAGYEPRDYMKAQDTSRGGMLYAATFGQVLGQLELLQTDHQLSKAVEDFSSISNRNMVLYEDFLDALDRAVASEGRAGMGMSGGMSGGMGMSGAMNTRAYDDVRNSMERWEEDSYRGRIELEDGSVGGSLSPPKGTRSPPRYAPVRNSYSNNSDGSLTPRTSRSIPAPRTSPRKVGVKMWGNDTPLAKKGKPLNVGPDRWLCGICNYCENATDAPLCAMCDSPNYNIRKDYQVREQCPNCTFVNGQFAEECEMCGEPLSHARR